MMAGDHLDQFACRLASQMWFPEPVFLELMLTEDCNLRCSYCFEKGKRPNHMTEATALKAIDLLLDQGQSEKHILFFGGEPLLRMDLIKASVEHVRQRGRTVNYSMTTNGLLLDEEVCRFLKDHGISYLLSIDGTRAIHDLNRRDAGGHGTWDRLMARLPLLKAYQPWQGARMTVTPDTVASMAEGVRTLFAHGINQFIIGAAHGLEWSASSEAMLISQFKEVAAFYHQTAVVEKRHLRLTIYEKGDLDQPEEGACRWGCGAGRGRICSLPDGRLFGCSKLATIRGAENGILPLGDVAAGLHLTANRARLNHLGIVDYPIACRLCPDRRTCGGGCYATNHLETGSISAQGSGFHCMCGRVYRAAKAEFARLELARNGPKAAGHG